MCSCVAYLRALDIERFTDRIDNRFCSMNHPIDFSIRKKRMLKELANNYDDQDYHSGTLSACPAQCNTTKLEITAALQYSCGNL
jgi:hypothetical protein